MKMLTFNLVWIFIFQIVLTLSDTTDDSISLQFEDNVIDGKFSTFAKMNIRPSRQSKIELVPTRTIFTLQYQRLIEEFQHNFHSYYTLKIHFKRRIIQDYIMTSIPMCVIIQTQFQYTINLFLNENGYPISVHILTNNSTCSMSNISTIDRRNDFVYKIPLHLQLNDLGPQPEIQYFLEKLKREKEAKLNAQENDNRPFILKYWKYLLPIVVIFVLQGAFTDAGAGGGR